MTNIDLETEEPMHESVDPYNLTDDLTDFSPDQ